MNNHLGNVLATVTDRRIQTSAGGVNVDAYTADVVSANDYYPFGMLMPGRNYSAGSYRFGFNGQEMDNEIKGGGNSYFAQFWEYDPRIGRRWNLDPVKKPWQSDYATFSDNSIWKMDPNGDDDFFNSKGQLVKRTKTGSNIYVQSNKGNVLLTQLSLASAHNRQTVANIVGYYASVVGVNYQPKESNENAGKGVVALAVGTRDPEENPGFTVGKDIFINKKGNKINSNLFDYYNLENVLIHEKGHKEGNENPLFKSNLQTHMRVYLNAIKDETFRKGTPDFQKGAVGSFSNYLLNFYANFSNGGTEELNKYVDDFNKNNKAGFFIQVNVSSGTDESGYKVNVYKHNKLIGTKSYKKINNEGSDE